MTTNDQAHRARLGHSPRPRACTDVGAGRGCAAWEGEEGKAEGALRAWAKGMVRDTEK
jgi:hypothetical protein